MKYRGYILPVSSIMKVRIEAKLATAVNYATSISVNTLVEFSLTVQELWATSIVMLIISTEK